MKKALTFWALAYQYEEDFFFDFATKEDTDALNETCFLPTKELAEQYIEDELSTDYVPVEITVERFNPFEMVYTRGTVARWDEVGDEELA